MNMLGIKGVASWRCNGSSGAVREGEGSIHKGKDCRLVGMMESVKCWASLGNRQEEPGLGGGEGQKGRRETRLAVGYGQLARTRRTLVFS